MSSDVAASQRALTAAQAPGNEPSPGLISVVTRAAALFFFETQAYVLKAWKKKKKKEEAESEETELFDTNLVQFLAINSLVL